MHVKQHRLPVENQAEVAAANRAPCAAPEPPTDAMSGRGALGFIFNSCVCGADDSAIARLAVARLPGVGCSLVELRPLDAHARLAELRLLCIVFIILYTRMNSRLYSSVRRWRRTEHRGRGGRGVC